MGGFFAGGTFALQIPDGTLASPGLPYKNDLKSGFYKQAGFYFALAVNSVIGGTIGASNTGYGYNGMSVAVTGTNNTSMGSQTLQFITTGANNTALGSSALNGIGAGSNNVAIGNLALSSADVNNCTALGTGALQNNTGSGSVGIGYLAGVNGFGNNKLYVNNSTAGNDLISGTFNTGATPNGSLLFTCLSVTQNNGTHNVTQQAGGFRGSEVANGKQGVATLVGGTITVNNTSITANSRILITAQETGVLAGVLRVTARVVGASFTIGSSNAGDTALVAYEIFEPA